MKRKTWFFVLFLFIVVGCASTPKDYDVEIYNAISNESIDKLSKLLQRNVITPDYQDKNGKTLLMYAAEKNSVQLMDYLLFSGANINYSFGFQTVLDFTMKNAECNIDTIKYLLNHGAKSYSTINDQSFAAYLLLKNKRRDIEEKLEIFELLKKYNICASNSIFFYNACLTGDIALIEQLMQKGFKVDSKINNLDTSCLMAVAGNSTIYSFYNEPGGNSDFNMFKLDIREEDSASFDEKLEYLLLNSSDINAQDVYGATALHYYIYGCFYHYEDSEKTKVIKPCAIPSLSIIQTMVSKGANINIKDKIFNADPLTLLMRHIVDSKADIKNYYDIIKYFVDNGSNLNEVDIYEASPWLYSVMSGDLKTIQIFAENKNCNLDQKIQTDDSELNALCISIMKNNISVLEYLLSKEIDVNGLKLIPILGMSCVYNNEKAFDLLLNAGADINGVDEDGFPVLHFAFVSKNMALIEKIVKNPKFNPNIVYYYNEHGTTLLYTAFECFIAENVNLSERQVGVLYVLISKMNKKHLNFIHKSNSNTVTALLYPMLCNYIDITKKMLENGADPNVIVNTDGQNYLIWAVSACSLDIVKLLVQYGADIKHKEQNGLTAIDYAKLKGKNDVYKYLINR